MDSVPEFFVAAAVIQSEFRDRLRSAANIEPRLIGVNRVGAGEEVTT